MSWIKSASKFTFWETSTDKNNIDIIKVNIKYMILRMPHKHSQSDFLVALQVMS